jgi:hypothetical protein
MNIIERGKAFVQRLRELASRSAWDWKRCPRCGDTDTIRHGHRKVHPWTLTGRKEVVIQRHLCHTCTEKYGEKKTYSEESALLVRGSWYAREVHRFTIDHWQHVGSSLRRTAEWTRSLIGQQERWGLWCFGSVAPPEGEQCHLSQATVERWLDRAGLEARKSVPEQLKGVPTSGQMATDGLWARLLGKQKRVVLALVDTVTGVIWPPVVVAEEDSERSWGRVFRRAKISGLDLDQVRGVASDGAKGLMGYLGRVLGWVNHQRCHFHTIRTQSRFSAIGNLSSWRAA